MAKLTQKQKRFCDEYLIDLNGTQASIRSGYSEKTAKEIGSQHLTKLHIQEYIAEKQKEIQDRTNITLDTVVKELAKIALFDIRKIYDDEGYMMQPHNLSYTAAAVVAGLKSRRETSGQGEDREES